MATIAKFTSEVKEYTSPKTNKTKYSRYIVDEANNKGIIESDTKAVIEAIVIGATLPNPSQYQRIQGTTCYWLSGKFTPKQSIAPAVHSVPPPVGVNNAPVQPNNTNVRPGYTAEELDKLLVHYMRLFLNTIQEKNVVFTEGMASIPNTWVMTATQQGVKISGSEEAVTSVVLDSKQAAVTPVTAPTPGIPITLMDARDKAIAQAEKIKQAKSNKTLVIPANCSKECEYIIRAINFCGSDEGATPEFIVTEWSKFQAEDENKKPLFNPDGSPKMRFMKDIAALLEKDAKKSKWVKKVYGNAKEWMMENHPNGFEDMPDDAIPEGAVRSDNGNDDDSLPF